LLLAVSTSKHQVSLRHLRDTGGEREHLGTSKHSVPQPSGVQCRTISIPPIRSEKGDDATSMDGFTFFFLRAVLKSTASTTRGIPSFLSFVMGAVIVCGQIINSGTRRVVGCIMSCHISC